MLCVADAVMSRTFEPGAAYGCRALRLLRYSDVFSLPRYHMESFVGTTGWYLVLLILGLITGALIQWFRQDREES